MSKKFTKAERSSFPYWFAHWKAYNKTAKQCKHWHLHYAFHDIEKPFLRLLLDYKNVQKIHRKFASHHIEYVINFWQNVFNTPLSEKGMMKSYLYYMFHFKPDIEGMIIDWECSRFTKAEEPLNAMEEWENVKTNKLINLIPNESERNRFICYLEPIMQENFEKLNLK